MAFLRRNLTYIVFLFVACVINIYLLYPVLLSDYFGDDLYNFQVHGSVPYYFSTILEMTQYYFDAWLDIGRFYPLAWYLYALFYVLNDLFFYKAFLVIVTILSAFCFSWMVYQFNKDKWFVLFLFMLSPLLFQFKFYHDPFLSFQGLIQFLSIFIFLSIGFYKIYLDSSKFVYLAFSLLFWVASLLLYEISYVFIFVFIFMGYFLKINKMFWLHVAALVLVLSIVLWFRVNASHVIDAYSPNFNLLKILSTWFFQTISVVPFSYVLSGKISGISFSMEYAYLFIFIFLSFYLYLRVSGFLNKRVDVIFNKYSKNYFLVFLSVFLIIMPGLFISFSPRYQDQISFGVAYLPIFIQYFGFALLLSLLIFFCLRGGNKGFAYLLLAGFFAFIGTIHHMSNWQVVSMVNLPYKDTRIALQEFYKEIAIQNFVKENATFCFEKDSPLNTREFLSLFLNRKVNVIIGSDAKCNFFIQYGISDLNHISVAIFDYNNFQLYSAVYK